MQEEGQGATRARASHLGNSDLRAHSGEGVRLYSPNGQGALVRHGRCELDDVRDDVAEGAERPLIVRTLLIRQRVAHLKKQRRRRPGWHGGHSERGDEGRNGGWRARGYGRGVRAARACGACVRRVRAARALTAPTMARWGSASSLGQAGRLSSRLCCDATEPMCAPVCSPYLCAHPAVRRPTRAHTHRMKKRVAKMRCVVGAMGRGQREGA